MHYVAIRYSVLRHSVKRKAPWAVVLVFGNNVAITPCLKQKYGIENAPLASLVPQNDCASLIRFR